MIKYIKISLGNFEVFTKVRVDGVKKNSVGNI